ncbi:hypothetical protein PRIPAC_87911 [Pristionchus pacificus]|uniref:Uncharacterized protein n=1 Tax=Pristionchus pacificus TaxID=54126 RepID=A0A454XNF8_PRIPA|nr:hypothetical protein PRIPAC_87911 [Pristionchus pacificus]|eukprot:PDM82913.1 hypothetical protein PRIPAC_37306 [Pristionchus pacificus]
MASSSSTSSRKPKRSVKEYVRRKTTDRLRKTASSSSASSASSSASVASSASSTGTGSTAPTYRVEENSDGELVNKRLGVTWPARAPRSVKRYPDYSSGQSTVPSSDGEDQFRTSPYEMISIAELDAATAAASAAQRALRGYPYDRVERERAYAKYVREQDSEVDDRYIDLCGTASPNRVMGDDDETLYDDFPWDQSPTNIDSVVFDTAEEMACYQRVIAASLRKKESKAKEEEKEEEKEELKSTVESTTQTEPEEETAGRREKTARDDADKHYIGVRSRRAVEKKLTPGQFYMYYEKPPGGEIPVTIELKIGYMSSTNKIYHFPIQRFGCQGESYYAVMQTDTDMKMFPTISALVQHYHTFSHVDPETGRLETFGLPI